MPNYGVIDLGSNSVRLCVYEVKDDKKKHYTKKDFRSLLNNKVIAGLSAYVENGVFTDRGIEHAIEVLHGHHKRLKYFNCKRTEVFATAVLRYASNSKEAIQAIEKATGFTITILSEKEEARLGFIGASADQELDNGTLIDIGGGSTELTRIRDARDSKNRSIPQGSLSSYAACVKGILPTEREANLIASSIKRKIAELDSPASYQSKTFFGIGGSLRAAAKVYREVFSTPQRPEILTIEDFEALISYCLERPDSYAHFALCAAPDRIHTVIPGCLIAQNLMKCFDAQELILCKNGVREGYLIEHMLLNKE